MVAHYNTKLHEQNEPETKQLRLLYTLRNDCDCVPSLAAFGSLTRKAVASVRATRTARNAGWAGVLPLLKAYIRYYIILQKSKCGFKVSL
jgi:hypothetical protein